MEQNPTKFRKQISFSSQAPLTISQIEEREEYQQKPTHEQVLVAVIGGRPVIALV